MLDLRFKPATMIPSFSNRRRSLATSKNNVPSVSVQSEKFETLRKDGSSRAGTKPTQWLRTRRKSHDPLLSKHTTNVGRAAFGESDAIDFDFMSVSKMLCNIYFLASFTSTNIVHLHAAV